MRYIEGDLMDALSDAYRQNQTPEYLEFLAGQVPCEPEHLANALGLPQWRVVPPAASAEFDLFATDRLDEVL